MDEELVRITPDKEKAKSILKMVNTTLSMIETISIEKFSSNVTKEYYEVVRELITTLLLLDGYKTYGEGAHKKLIEYLEKNYTDFSGDEIHFLDDLRIVRNKISYDGFFVTIDYIGQRRERIKRIIAKLQKNIKDKF